MAEDAIRPLTAPLRLLEMLFNSAEFLFAFLPITLLGFYVLGRASVGLALSFLVAASLVYYGYWKPEYLLIIVGSTVFNFLLGSLIGSSGHSREIRQRVMIAGIACNLALLGYYKYTGFLFGTINALTGAHLPLLSTVLPLGISFFTFQQIAYLVDAYRGETREMNLSRYALFVAFFPQLIAGPIVHHKEVLPQFRRRRLFEFRAERINIGLTLLLIGLFKKVVLADGVAEFARPLFMLADEGGRPSTIEAWGGALAYTFQLYFDFSGYSDMALGLGRLFGIKLPQNFNSPYRSTSIVEFWQSWHITLSQFLRDYLYIPLGGNRRGKARRYVNLMTTMLLGGLWHGAGWNFVIWGGLHGAYLVVNHAFRTRFPNPPWDHRPALLVIPWSLTFVAVVVGWVYFRATTHTGAWTILSAMFMFDGLHLPLALAEKLGSFAPMLETLGIHCDLKTMPTFGGVEQMAWLVGLLAVTTLLPNSCELMKHYRPTVLTLRHKRSPLISFHMRMTPGWAIAFGAMGLITLAHLQRVSEFLYFQF